MDFKRYCANGNCGSFVPKERLAKSILGRSKVFFCSDKCRYDDANSLRAARRSMKAEKGLCPKCHGRGYTRVNRQSNEVVGDSVGQSEVTQ